MFLRGFGLGDEFVRKEWGGGGSGGGGGGGSSRPGPLLSATAGRAVSLFQGLIKENQQKIGSSFGTEKFKVSKDGSGEGPVKG